jgi:hypothetical protein
VYVCFDALEEGLCAQQALNLKGSQSAATTPLLVSLLQQQQQRQRQRAQDEDKRLELDDDPLRSLPSERQLQSSSSVRDESVEFDELEAELAQTQSRTPPPPPPGVSAAASRTTSSPQKSPSRDVAPVKSPAKAPAVSLAPKQPHLSSLGGWARRTLTLLLVGPPLLFQIKLILFLRQRVPFLPMTQNVSLSVCVCVAEPFRKTCLTSRRNRGGHSIQSTCLFGAAEHRVAPGLRWSSAMRTTWRLSSKPFVRFHQTRRKQAARLHPPSRRRRRR